MLSVHDHHARASTRIAALTGSAIDLGSREANMFGRAWQPEYKPCLPFSA